MKCHVQNGDTMRYRIFEDIFAKKQPGMGFVEELLRPVHSETPKDFNTREAEGDEIFIPSLVVNADFPDPEGLLDTAYADLRKFMEIAHIAEREDGIALRTVMTDTECREAYRITVTTESVTVGAADTEGIRRGLIYLEDEMLRRSGAFLPIGVIERKPFIRARISRCFFAPPSHASNEGMVNELASDIDYYPDEYLNRLAHDGINALWLGASFHDILKSDVIPECGADSERRLKKLYEVVEKCRRYGIGIYLFSIEPASGYSNPQLQKHPELLGSKGRYGNTHLFCPSTDGCREYIRGAIKRLFSAVPHLAGFMNISTGECLSGCGSYLSLECPRCRERFGSHAATLAATEKLIADAMHEFAPNAEFISWTYNQRAWNRDTVKESCELRDPSIIHMQNFEDYGRPLQLGRKRLATDYWLSYVGPGEIMSDSLAINKRRGIRTYAKIQACSSHEISTVPYVPVPGILYDKYKYMHDNGISGVVQCWYFGNYPCMMNKAASELSFEPFFTDKDAFLTHLAGIYWGKDAPEAVKAWRAFEEGYRNFPVSVSFEWFGPMQDSPAVPLHLIPVDLPLPSTWLVNDPVGGDRIGECLTDGHTMDEVLELSSRMCELWKKGNERLSSISDGGSLARMEQKNVSSAISVIFESGLALLRFYDLRHRLGLGKGDVNAILDEMESIAREETDRSRKLMALCEADSRLGYHSEAHGYKFFKEKLEWCIEQVEKCLETEFSEVRRRIAAGLMPLAFYGGTENGARRVVLSEGGSHNDFINPDGESVTSLDACEKNGKITLTFRMKDSDGDSLTIRPEFHMFHPTVPLVLKDGKLVMEDSVHYSFVGEYAEERRKLFRCEYRADGDGEVYTLYFDRADLGMEADEPFRLAVSRSGKHKEQLCADDRVYTRLIQGRYSPDAYAFFVGE